MILRKKLLPLQPFVISFKGLKAGVNEFHWHADGEFFESFGNPDIRDANLEIEVKVTNEDWEIGAEVWIHGTVTVLCCRCLGDLDLPVDVSFETSGVQDLSQDIYDEVCVSLPMTWVHEDGGCDEDTVRFLSK